MRKLCAVRPALWLPLLTFIIIQFSLSSQNFQFERVPNDLGLSQNFVSALAEDKDGFLWVGTKDGLNRFDGYRFEVFQNDPFDSTTISGNYVKCILEDSHGRLWIGTTNGLNIFDRKREIFHRLSPKSEFKEITEPITENYQGFRPQDIPRIIEDEEGNIWAGTMHNSILKVEMPPESQNFEEAKITLFSATESRNSLWHAPVKSLATDESGHVWTVMGDSLCVIQKKANSHNIRRFSWEEFDPKWEVNDYTNFTFEINHNIKIDKRFHAVFNDKNGAMWLKTAGGFAKWKPTEKRFEFYHLDVDLNNYRISPLANTGGASLFDSKGNLWIGGTGALVIYNPNSYKILARNHHQEDNRQIGIRRTGFQAILEDRIGNIWIGTTGHGLYKHTPQIKKFSGRPSAELLKNYSLRSIHETDDGIVWMGQTNLRAIKWNRKTGEVLPLVLHDVPWDRTNEKVFDYIMRIKEDSEGNLWMSGERGLFRIKHEKGNITDWKLFEIRRGDGSNKPSAVLDIHIDKTGKFWLITHYEFGQFDPKTGKFDGLDYLKITKSSRREINFPSIYQQADGTFWLATDEGLLKFEEAAETFTLFPNNPKNPQSLSHRLVTSIYPDPVQPEEILWVGTGGGGLNRFEIKTGAFQHFKKQDGLPDNVIYGILGDSENNLWLSTNQGLSRFNPASGFFKNYTAANGLQDNEFNTAAYFKNKKGELFFGGINGVNVFRPEEIEDNPAVPSVVLTDFKLANKSVDFEAENSLLKQSISETEELVLSWKDNIFSFEFAALDLTNSVKNQYAYKLENFDEEWQYIGTKRTATFTNIEPGEYIFKAKGTNHDGVWNKEGTSMKITILPPWWKTWWAYLGYFFLLTSGILFLYKFQLNRQLERAETKRLTELDALKTRLYNNITHEFRTPLTVIMGMTEQLAVGSWQSAVSKKEKEEIGKGFSLIRRNGNNLLRLINQMLDLSKLESGTMKLDAGQSDIIGYLQYLTESFYSMAQEKNIRMVFYPEMSELIMDFDENKLQHVVYNLLSNAIKFTENGGKIVFHANKETPNGSTFLKLKLADTGIGIEPENLENIFNRFYQVDDSSTRKGEGTGIGLSLTKELVELMGGSISVESEVGKGTTFTILLPINNEAELCEIQKDSKLLFDKNLSESNALLALNNSKKSSDLPLVLIVEDNTDVATYIGQILEKDYQCIFAQNGQKGIESALETIPDIIISDVMMPEKDGFELTEILKKDERTSHIPIVLLTAKATEEDKIIGLKTGADAYLMKPFNKEELFIRLEKLLELRLALQNKYSNGNLEKSTESKPITELTIEDIFLQKLQKTVEEKLDDPNLNPEILAKAVHLSQSQLYRKLKALTNDSPNYFIRKIRLKKALHLLKTTNMNVSEVAYEVGFNDPNYFSRVFHKEFGKSPSVFNK